MASWVTFGIDSGAMPQPAIPRKQRAMVRKGIKHGLEARFEDHLDNFYPIFSESYRNLGTPVLSRSYFEAIRHGFGEDCSILTVFKDGTAVASVMTTNVTIMNSFFMVIQLSATRQPVCRCHIQDRCRLHLALI